MTDLEIFESFCPQVEPLSAHARAGLRLDLFGSERLSEPRPSNDVQVDAALGRGAGGEPPRRASGRRLLAVAAVSVIVVGVAGVWLAVGSRDVEAPAPALQPSSTSTDGASELQPPESPLWYDTIRPLLPDGFDQIVLTTAQPEVVAFKAFRTGTRQLLDITITLEPGYDIKDTGEVATFSDDHGDYIESTSAVALTTPDQRRVLVRCGLSPVGGGVVGSVGLVDSVRDYCGAGFDNLDLDPASRRALAATLAEEFPTDIVTSAFGQPSPRAESTTLAATISDFIGEERPFAMEQADGVLRVADLSPNAGGPPITELTVINGIWPPDGDGSAFDDIFANSPLGRFYNYDDIAVALVAVDRIAFHIATTDVSEANLEQLGELIQRLIDDATANSEPTTPAIGTQPAITSATPTTSSVPTSFPVLDTLPDGLSATASVQEIANGVTTPPAGWLRARNDARELAISDCMAGKGFEYKRSPNLEDGPTDGSAFVAFDRWTEWRDQQIAQTAGFAVALLGSGGDGPDGCTREALSSIVGAVSAEQLAVEISSQRQDDAVKAAVGSDQLANARQAVTECLIESGYSIDDSDTNLLSAMDGAVLDGYSPADDCPGYNDLVQQLPPLVRAETERWDRLHQDELRQLQNEWADDLDRFNEVIASG